MANHEAKGIVPHVIRKTVVLFVIRVIVLELVFEIIYLTWRGLVHFLPFSLEVSATLNFISLIIFLILVTIIQNIFLIYLAASWSSDYYEIRADEIVHVSGIFSKTEKAYPYRGIQSITIHQDFLGRIFNYGSVHIYIPALGQDLNFPEIPNPVKFVEVIKSANPKGEGERYFLRR